MKKLKKLFKNLIDTVISIGVAVVIALFISKYIATFALVPTASMQPTLNIGDKLLVNRLYNIDEDVQRGDIIVFKFPDNPELLYVKRVIGLPGETIEGITVGIKINGKIIKEDYVKPTAYDFEEYKIPSGCYFMLGDNRDDSYDSRYWENTYISKDSVIGKVVYRVSPNSGNIH